MVRRPQGRRGDEGAVEFDRGHSEARLPEPPTQDRGVRKRDRLYAAALRRFSENGVAETRVEDVVADAGVSWATFFRYFPRKEDVLIEAAARHFRARVAPVGERALGDRRTRIRRAIERVFATLLEPDELSPALHLQAFLEVFNHPERFAALVGAGPVPLVGLVVGLIAEGQARGEVDRELDPGAAGLTVVAGAMFPAVQASAAGADPAQSIGQALDVLWAGLAA